MTEEIKIKGGLKELPEDSRDLSLGGIFGVSVNLEDLPEEYFLPPKIIKDQGDSDLCTAFAITSVSEDQEDVVLSPEYQFAKTKQLVGKIDDWGADLRSACQSAKKFGSIPMDSSPLFLETVGRDVVADWTKWPAELDQMAQKYRKSGFYKVDGPFDLFDNIRAALWQNRGEKRTIVVGALWRDSWTRAKDGVIPSVYGPGNFGHAFKICGWKYIDGELHLIAQLSSSERIGDKGLFYFPREVVNKEMDRYGQFMFKDLTAEDARYYQNYNIKVSDNWLMQFIKILLTLIFK